jgi:hypothetical protein
MKRQQTSFSVEVKKSRTQGQRPHLPPRPLFEVVPSADEAPRILQNEVGPKVAEPTTAPRILPSIVEPRWSRSEPAEPVRRKRSSGETKPGQMEFNLNAASDDEADVSVQTPVHAKADVPTAIAVETGAMARHDVQSAMGKSAKSDARRARTKASAVVEPAQAPGRAPEAEPTPHAGMIARLTGVSSASSEHRLSKRLAAAGHLPRSERWKRRLHPTSW